MSHSSVPDWAEPFKVGEYTFGVDGRIYLAHILSRELEPNLAGFVGFPEGTFLFLSEDIPEEFRSHILGHEVREFGWNGQEGRCVRALHDELKSVDGQMLVRYLNYRLEFFRRLVAFYADQEGESIDPLKREIAGSLSLLETISCGAAAHF